MQSDIWKFPVNGSPAENTRRGVRITHQTGQAQTPSVSPDESEVVYLSDSGGHGNLWIARTDGSGVRQITFERDPAISVGVPVWSPTGNEIVFILTRAGDDRICRSSIATAAASANWSLRVSRRIGPPTADGCTTRGRQRRMDLHREGANRRRAGDFRTVRQRQRFSSDARRLSAVFRELAHQEQRHVDHEIGRARPENGPSEVLARVAGSRVPVNRRYLVPVLSPDGQWLTMPLSDGATSNIWVLPTSGEADAAAHGLRRSLRRDRPPRLVVARQQVSLRRRGGHRCRHRPAGRPAPITSRPAERVGQIEMSESVACEPLARSSINASRPDASILSNGSVFASSRDARLAATRLNWAASLKDNQGVRRARACLFKILCFVVPEGFSSEMSVVHNSVSPCCCHRGTVASIGYNC